MNKPEEAASLLFGFGRTLYQTPFIFPLHLQMKTPGGTHYEQWPLADAEPACLSLDLRGFSVPHHHTYLFLGHSSTFNYEDALCFDKGDSFLLPNEKLNLLELYGVCERLQYWLCFVSVCVCDAGERAQGLTHARQALCHGAAAPNSGFFFFYHDQYLFKRLGLFEMTARQKCSLNI